MCNFLFTFIVQNRNSYRYIFTLQPSHVELFAQSLPELRVEVIFSFIVFTTRDFGTFFRMKNKNFTTAPHPITKSRCKNVSPPSPIFQFVFLPSPRTISARTRRDSIRNNLPTISDRGGRVCGGVRATAVVSRRT